MEGLFKFTPTPVGQPEETDHAWAARQFEDLHPMLQAVFYAAASFAWGMFGKRLLITCIDRDDTSVHAYGRGLDVDVCEAELYPGGLLPGEAEVIASHINQLFRYDTARPQFSVALFGVRDKKRKHDNHIHFQVCQGNRTVYRPREFYEVKP